MKKCNCINKIRVYNILINGKIKNTANSLIEAESIKDVLEKIGYNNIKIIALDICKNCLQETIVK
jgi:hypothetical protein